jgi:hypothetical protein
MEVLRGTPDLGPVEERVAYLEEVVAEQQELIDHLRRQLAHEEERRRYRDQLIDELIASAPVRRQELLCRVEAFLMPRRARMPLSESILVRRDGNV